MNTNAALYGIGVGPGDPELMTLKAVRVARECDVIALPHKDRAKCVALQIALGAAPDLAEKETVCVDMPMTKDAAVLEKAHDAGAKKIMALLDNGKSVAFLTLGDPTVYSTYFYIHQRVAQAGYSTRVIPGVTSFCASAARLGVALCENREELHIIPGTYDPEKALDYPGVKVLMKNDLPTLRRAILERGLSAQMVENCGHENERVYRSARELPENAGYYSLLIVR